jgi:type II secretion system (T2SS) protein E
MVRLIGYVFVNPCLMAIPQAARDALPGEFARQQNAMPVGIAGKALKVAVDDPFDFELIDKLRFCCNRPIEIVVADRNAVRCAVERYYGFDCIQ